MAVKISASMLNVFQRCPFAFRLRHLSTPTIVVPKYVRTVFGSALHYVLLRQFYRKLSVKAKEARLKNNLPLVFPKDKKSVIGIWIRIWREALKEEGADKKIAPFACKIKYDGKTEKEIKEEQDLYLRWGIEIVGRYWEIHAFQPLPIAVEFPFSVFTPHRADILLTGSIDQIRKTDGEFWLLDLKTGIDTRAQDWKDQYSFHHDYQFTIYSYAFRQIFGEKEKGIIIYPLNYYKDKETQENKDREAIFTFRNETDYQALVELLDFFIASNNGGVFPRYYGGHCKSCEYIEICDGDKKIFTNPVSVGKIDFGKIDSIRLKKEVEKELAQPRFCRPTLKF